MTPESIARRYASALYDVAARAGSLDAVSRDLAALASLVASHDDLMRVFASPGVPSQRKRAIAERVLFAAGEMSSEVRRLVLLLADRDRLMFLSLVEKAFADRLRRARHELPAEIITAVSLGQDRTAALAHALGRATGTTVTVTERVDPAIIGGLVAKVGGLVFDGSVTRQLERLGHRLRAGS